MNASSSQFHQLSPQMFVGSEIEFLCAVVAKVAGGRCARLQAIGPYNLARPYVLDQEVIANLIEFIALVTILVRGFRAFSQFQIEHEKTKPERVLAILARFRKTHPIGAGPR